MKPQNESPRAPAIQVFSGPLADGLRRELVYAGDLLVFKGVEPITELCALTDELIREALGALDPVRAQFELDREDYVARVGNLQKLYRKHGRAKGLFLATLGRVGVDLRRTCWDWLHLRVLPHGEGKADRQTGRLGVHRDTWASNVYAQTNWWAPIRGPGLGASGRRRAWRPAVLLGGTPARQCAKRDGRCSFQRRGTNG